MLLTPLFFILHDLLAKRMKEEGPSAEPDEIAEQEPIIIAGIGRFGQVVNRVVTHSGFKTTVLDNDLETIRLMRKFGFKGYYGDPSRPELLAAAGIAKAQVLVACMDDQDAVTRLVTYARRERPDLHIIARAHDRAHVFALYKAGADDIVREMFDSSLRAGRYVLENVGMSEFEASEMAKIFFKVDRAAMRDLAEAWKPGVAVEQNHAYIKRAKELDRQMELALMARFRTEVEGKPTEVPDEAV
jgi:CPA2 family monovalent cation:H+ antiporter-2